MAQKKQDNVLTIDTMERYLAKYMEEIVSGKGSIDESKAMANLIGKGLKAIQIRMDYDQYRSKGGKIIKSME